VYPVPDPLLLRKSGGAGNRTQTPGSVARNSDSTKYQTFPIYIDIRYLSTHTVSMGTFLRFTA
jgi:hypothetical protein